jgi:N-acetylglutamate synthase-like GNAT family acetyltransferase
MKNVDIQVLSSMKCCLRVISSGSEIDTLCARLTELLALLSIRPVGFPLTVSRHTLESFFDYGGHLVVALDKDQNIVGMGRLVFDYESDGKITWIKDVIVDKAWRRWGIGERILVCLIELALAHQVQYVNVTISPDDVVTNALFDKFGFSELTSNVRRLVLNTDM